MSKKKSKLQLAQDKAQSAINKTNEIIEKLGSHTNSLYSVLNDIQELFDKIRNVPNEKRLQYEKLKDIRLNWKQQAEKIEKDYKHATATNAGAGAAGLRARRCRAGPRRSGRPAGRATSRATDRRLRRGEAGRACFRCDGREHFRRRPQRVRVV